MYDTSMSPEFSHEKTNPHFETVDALQTHMQDIYHVRNEVYLPGRSERIELFNNGIHNLVEAIRLSDQSSAETALARLGSRVFCIADALAAVQVEQGLDAKFPSDGCLFCGQAPCNCNTVRGLAQPVQWPPAGERRKWSLDNWQTFLGHVYGDSNDKTPLNYSITRLYTENGELTTLENNIRRGQLKLDQIPEAYSIGCADLMAWVLAVGNRLGIGVQLAIEERYGNGCPTCGNSSCRCSPAEFDHVYPSLD